MSVCTLLSRLIGLMEGWGLNVRDEVLVHADSCNTAHTVTIKNTCTHTCLKSNITCKMTYFSVIVLRRFACMTTRRAFN